MASAVTPAPPQPAPLKRVAPWLHTTLILLFLLFGSLYGSGGRQQALMQQHGRIRGYASLVIVEWLVAGLVWVSIRRERVTLRELVGGKWDKFESALLDVAFAAGFWFVSLGVLAGVGWLLGIARARNLDEVMRTVGFLAPHNNLELLLWVGVCLTAGFCEELIFRGFFQRQFSALTRSAWAGVILQGILFGAAHGYQGLRRMTQIAVFGILFGLLALWRKNLRPGMIAHAWQDGITGFVLFLVGKIKGW